MPTNRGFELVSRHQGDQSLLPKRATKYSAGYDFVCAHDTMVPSLWRQAQGEDESSVLKTAFVPTGVKAYMPENEYLLLANRSSNPKKNGLAIPNGVGIIDADYYGNDKNEGEIFVQMINYGREDYLIKKGDRIAQGIFTPYYTVDEEGQKFAKRTGGFGSSGK